MPKVIDTRKQRAIELLRELQNGPVMAMPYERLDQDQISKHYRLWAETWVLEELIDLIPELRQAKKEGKL